MVHIELNEEEAAELREILKRYLSDLRMEIADTDTTHYKDRLRAEKVIVSRILEQIAAQTPVAQ